MKSNEGTIDLTPEMIQRLKAEEYSRGQPRNRSGNTPKSNKAKSRARVKAARKARKAGRK